MYVLINRDELAEELKFLRKRRAVRDHALLKRLGVQTKALCGISDQDSVVVARRKISHKINEFLVNEAEDVRLAVLVALALHPEADQRDLKYREAWLAQQLNVQERTARRRVEEAFELLIDIATGEHPASEASSDNGAADAWYSKALRSILRLDTPSPELIEQRTIVITRGSIKELNCQLSLPRRRDDSLPQHDLYGEVLYGGHMHQKEQEAEGHFRFVIELPRTLHAGDTHEYGMLFKIPAGQPMCSHYVLQPLSPCESFDLTVRFDPNTPPGCVWRFNGVPQRVVDDDRPNSDILPIDRFCELRLEFRNLCQGLAYGVKWAM